MTISVEEQKRRYAELMGKDALERQEKQKRERCFYCGGWRPNGHLNLCKHKGEKR